MTDKKEMFLVPYAHLDTQWRWDYPTTIKKYIKSTLDDNIYLFEKYPAHQFNFAGALRYIMMQEYYPEEYLKAKKLIQENRWHIAGTCLDETDPLTPSVESMIRNILYGDRWAKEELGKSSFDYLVPDCFGFPANMPTVLTHCGIKGFSTQKLTWGSVAGIPFEIGMWQGPDNSELLSAVNPGSYGSRLRKLVQNDEKRLQHLEKLGKQNGVWKCFQYYGTGDIGGAPDENSVKNITLSIEESQKGNGDLIVKQGSPDDFFIAFSDQEKKQIDRYSGDFLLTNHSAGTLTSAAYMKRWNRMNEQMAFAAEVAAVTALQISGIPYPDQKIKSAWYRIIGNQMHDILPGTSTPTAYEYSHNDEVVALNTWSAIIQDSAMAIAPYVKGDGNILLFNPLAQSRNEPVDVELQEWNEKDTTRALIVDSDGNKLPLQIWKAQSGKYIATFIPTLKPCSWSRFSIRIDESGNLPKVANPVSVTTKENEYILENENYRVTVLKDGTINSIYQKKIQKELLKKPLAYEFQKETPFAYPSWNMDWKDRKKKPYKRIENGGKVSIIENGPLRCSIQISIIDKASNFVKEICLSHNSPIVDIIERIHWRGKGCSLKLALTTNMPNSSVTYNWETSRTQRGINYEKLFEMPSRYWVDISEQKWGVSLIEDSKYGYDHPSEEVLRMTLLYTPAAAHLFYGFKDQKWHDWGDHTIRYAIYGHDGDYTTTDKLARCFNQRIRSFLIAQDESNKTKKSISMVEISNEQIGILAIKKAEDSDGVLIRLYDRFGKSSQAEIRFESEIDQVIMVNGIEEPLEKVVSTGSKFNIKLEANQIRSYIVKFRNILKQEVIPQEPIKLEYNSKLIGKNGDLQAVIPSELTPPTIPAGAISYQLVPEAKLNTLQCTGQKIPISEKYDTLSILIGANASCDTVFQWMDQGGKLITEDKCQISALTGFRGSWDQRKWLLPPQHDKKYVRDYVWLNYCTGVKPGFVNRDRVEWYATHTHKNGEDQLYKYGYLTTKTITIPKGAKSLILPNDPQIYIFAMTASKQQITVKSNSMLRDKYDF